MFRHPLFWILLLFIGATTIAVWPRTVPDLPGANLEKGLAAYKNKDYVDAEKYFREELRIVRDQRAAQEELAILLLETGRSWEAQSCIRPLMNLQPVPVDSLILFAADPDLIINEQVLEHWSKSAPMDPVCLIGLAKKAFSRGKMDEARTLLDRVPEEHPEQLEAQAVKGKILLTTAPVRLIAWDKQLPKHAASHPDIWFIRGGWAQHAGNLQMAIRCFVEGLLREPNDRGANLRLGQLLGPERGKPFLDRAEHLQTLFDIMAQMHRKQASMERVWEVVDLMKALERSREAACWGQVAMTQDARMMLKMTTNEEFAKSYRDLLAAAEKKQDSVPVSLLEFRNYPEWEPLEISDHTAEEKVQLSQLRFRDDAESAGLKFVYFNADDPETDGMRMQEMTGGGIGVTDLDLDGWPDLYFTQGCEWPPGTSGRLCDKFFRNRFGRSFADVTVEAGIHEAAFGQGVTVADFNSDGFDDICVGNIGPNQLLFGNGDGTFSEDIAFSDVAGDDWTCSCGAGDFNGDGLTDLFVVNYLHGHKVFEAICENQNIAVTCAPSNFECTDDCVLINLGDGRFEDQSAAAGIEIPGGSGLGIVIANFTPDQDLDIFVANDQRPNFYFVNHPNEQSNGDAPRATRFEEQAVGLGLALDSQGKAQACMGVAVADINADAVPDLFVTNFANESNTLYLSQIGGSFFDMTQQAGLTRASFEMLGFGTAFLDADLDGKQDLIVTNGHIGDHRYFGQRFRMPAQVFGNVGTLSQPRFAEIPASVAGSFFSLERLGRGLAVLDWNQDGRPDVCVSYLNDPAALLTNETQTNSHYFAIRLCGVNSPRDAVGTRLRIESGDETAFFQLTGGGSFESASQRWLICGLGDETSVKRLTILWPSGKEQSFGNIAADQVVTVVEGRNVASPQ